MKKYLLLILLLHMGHQLCSMEYKLYDKIQLNAGIIFDIEQDTKTGLYWIATENGIMTYNGFEFNKSDIVPSSKSIVSIKITNDKIHFILKDGIIGLHQLSNGKTKFYSPNHTINFDQIKSLSFQKGNYDYEGIILKNEGQFYKLEFLESVYSTEPLSDNDIRIFENTFYDYPDKKDIINFYGNNTGVFCYTNNELLAIDQFNKAQKIDKFNNFTSLIIDLDDNLLVTNYSGYIFIYKKSDLIQEFHTNKIIRRATCTGQNTFYYCDEDFNLIRVNNGQSKFIFENKERKIVDDRIFLTNEYIFFNHLTFKNDLLLKYLEKIVTFDSFRYKNQNAYIGTGYADIKIYREGKFYNHYTEKIGGKNGFFNKLTDLKTIGNKIYYSTKLGLNCLTFQISDSTVNFGKTKVLQNQYISNLIKNGARIYYTVDKSDVYVLNSIDNTYKRIFQGKNYDLNTINAMDILNDSFVFLATDQGVFELHLDKNQVVNFVKVISHSGIHAIENANDVSIFGRRLYISTYSKIYSEAISWHQNSSFKIQKSLYELYNSNLQFDAVEKIYNISGKDRNLKIKFYTPTFIKYYQFNTNKAILIHNDDTILSATIDGNIVNYENLDIGEYKLLLLHRDASGMYILSNTILFNVIPFYFETTFFRFLILTFLLLIVILIISFLNISLKNRLMRAENENFNLKLLKSQLRPHFLYNTLNTLKSVVYHKKNDLALDLIDKFTIFLRHNLSVDNELETSLRKELKEIENYLEIENFRTNNKIQFTYSIEENERVVIPSNILQPVIENAILHGMKDNQPLTIRLEAIKKPKLLEVNVLNDGKPLTSTSDDSGNSYALKSIRSRISTFNKYKIKDCLKLENIEIKGETWVKYTIKIRLKRHENPNH